MSQERALLIETITNGPFMENCFVVGDPVSRKALLIDPGDEEQRILARIRALDLEVQEILCTHAHIDHAGAVAPLKRLLGAPFAIHAEEQGWLSHLPSQAAAFGLSPKEIPEVDRTLDRTAELSLGELRAEILETPGHSAGGLCFLFPEQRVLFAGDTLFAGSVGRTDLPGGSTATLLASINEQLLSLEDDVVVYCGHGPPTDIGTERRTNPFLQADSPFIL
jgi:glyoxylase-like metal-dependent hydrolase (beta-lactamase superfamily II)